MGLWGAPTSAPTCKFKSPLHHTLPAGWKIPLHDTPRNPITVAAIMINKHRGQSPSCHFPAPQKQPQQQKQGAEMKFYSRLIKTSLSEESWDSRLFFLFILLATLEVLWVIPSSQAPPKLQIWVSGSEHENETTSGYNLTGNDVPHLFN